MASSRTATRLATPPAVGGFVARWSELHQEGLRQADHHYGDFRAAVHTGCDLDHDFVVL
jgi:hypothetical protein